MALSFGVTVLPDPPYQRLVELMVLAESHGFEYGWTYDSHVLWQDSFPILTLAAAATTTMKFGHQVTNPGTRDPTVVASLYATLHDISNGRMVMGIGRGDSAVRYIGRQPVKVAEFERDLAMIKPFMNGEEVVWNEKELQLKWVRPELPEIEMWVAGYGPKALAVAGRVGDGVIIQLADPEIIQWIMGTARAAAEEAGRDPAALKCIVCAPSMITDDIAVAREETRWFPAMVSNHVKDLIDRYGTDGSVVPKALTDYVEARKFYDYNEHSRVGADAWGVRDRRDLRPLLRARDGRAGDGEAARARGDRRRPVLDLPDDAQPGGDARGLRRAHHPRVQRRGGIGDTAAEQVEAWRSVAAGWERQRELFARATGVLSARMIELLEPRPGQRILDLAAGPGEVGFEVLPLIQPGGELLSTDVAPEMVEVARRRAAALGLDGIEFAVEDAARLSLPDASVDGVICRFGLMLVPDMASAAAEIARVLHPGGRVVLAVWASSRVNPWITAGGRAALELGFTEPPDHDAPGPFRLGDPVLLRSVLEGGGLEIELSRGGRRGLGGGVGRCVVGRDARHLAHALEPPRAPDARRDGRVAGAFRGEPAEFVAADGSLSVPGLARVVVAVPT